MIERVEIKEGQLKIEELKKGQIQKGGNRWYFACPRCGMGLGLDHEVEISDNKEVTINPSIGCPQCRLHIFVRKGKIEYLSDI